MAQRSSRNSRARSRKKKDAPGTDTDPLPPTPATAPPPVTDAHSSPHAFRSTFPLTSGVRSDGHASRTPESPLVSIVIPFYNEEACVTEVLEEIRSAQPGAEIIAVDDGSKDATWEKISALPWVTGLRLLQNRGQSAAMFAGLRSARGRVCVLMDGDGQNDPANIADLVSLVASGEPMSCVGAARQRQDTEPAWLRASPTASVGRSFTTASVTPVAHSRPSAVTVCWCHSTACTGFCPRFSPMRGCASGKWM
ncbi:MAG: glycosyltransferase [Verrucomicrobiales bacterium]